MCLWRHTSGVAPILHEIKSDSGRGVEKLILKPRNSHRRGKIDLSCISVWDGAGLYYCQQIVACPSRKGLWKHWELVSVNLSQFIMAAVLPSAALCIRIRNISCKWFVTTVLTLSTCPATLWNFVRIFRNDSETILSDISALCPGGQAFPS